jgi:hypothetical protein
VLSHRFVSSQRVLSLIGTARLYTTRPSTLMGVEDEYTAYCLDEACAHITARMDSGENPVFESHYTRFSDMYRELKQGGVST